MLIHRSFFAWSKEGNHVRSSSSMLNRQRIVRKLCFLLFFLLSGSLYAQENNTLKVFFQILDTPAVTENTETGICAITIYNDSNETVQLINWEILNLSGLQAQWEAEQGPILMPGESFVANGEYNYALNAVTPSDMLDISIQYRDSNADQKSAVVRCLKSMCCSKEGAND